MWNSWQRVFVSKRTPNLKSIYFYHDTVHKVLVKVYAGIFTVQCGETCTNFHYHKRKGIRQLLLYLAADTPRVVLLAENIIAKCFSLSLLILQCLWGVIYIIAHKHPSHNICHGSHIGMQISITLRNAIVSYQHQQLIHVSANKEN